MKNYYGCIYKITDLLTNKLYIGKTTKRNRTTNYALDRYLEKGGGGVYIRRLVKKYGTNRFKKEILGYCESKEELDHSEIECIYFFRSFGSDGVNLDNIYGYNLTPGGDGRGLIKGSKHSDETKRKISASTKGRKFSDEHKEKLRLAKINNPVRYWQGKSFSDEHKAKLKEKKQNMSEETKVKMSKAQKGRVGYWKDKKLPNDVIEKIASKKRGKSLTEEHKAKISKGVQNAKCKSSNGRSIKQE